MMESLKKIEKLISEKSIDNIKAKDLLINFIKNQKLYDILDEDELILKRIDLN